MSEDSLVNLVVYSDEIVSDRDLSNVPIIIADSSDEHSLNEMARRTCLIINVVGPYRLYGEAVVKAAVRNGTSHVDISGEPAVITVHAK